MELAAISIDNVDDAVGMATLVGAEYPILADPEVEMVRSYGVFDLQGDGVAAPATFVIGEDGVIKWRQVGKDIRDRLSPDEILQRVFDS